jgi:hypothetical protein
VPEVSFHKLDFLQIKKAIEGAPKKSGGGRVVKTAPAGSGTREMRKKRSPKRAAARVKWRREKSIHAQARTVEMMEIREI